MMKLYFGGNKFIISSTNINLAYSTDGITWTAASMPGGGHSPRLAYNGSLWMASYLSVNSSAYSTDGITWTVGGNTPASPSTGWCNPVYGNSIWATLFTSLGTTTNVFTTSPTGVTWTARTLPLTGQVEQPQYANSIFIAGCLDSANVLTSTDGITWTTRTAAAGSTYTRGITYG